LHNIATKGQRAEAVSEEAKKRRLLQKKLRRKKSQVLGKVSSRSEKKGGSDEKSHAGPRSRKTREVESSYFWEEGAKFQQAKKK